MKLEKFEASDFRDAINHNLDVDLTYAGMYVSLANVLSIVNRKIDTIIKSATPVKGYYHMGDIKMPVFGNPEKSSQEMTHHGLLINVGELQKEPCKHVPDLRIGDLHNIPATAFTLYTNCKRCGAELKAKWEINE